MTKFNNSFELMKEPSVKTYRRYTYLKLQAFKCKKAISVSD